MTIKTSGGRTYTDMNTFLKDFTNNIVNDMRTVAIESINELEPKAAEVAQKSFNSRTGRLAASFGVFPAYPVGNNQVLGHVFAGGQAAPYAEYVDVGHYLRNGKWLEGQHFMAVGAEHAGSIAASIIAKNLKKVF